MITGDDQKVGKEEYFSGVFPKKIKSGKKPAGQRK